MHNFRELLIWKEGMSLAADVLSTTTEFPSKHLYGLTSQIDRSAISIPSNIAEGSGRNSNKEFVQFLHISLGSSYELETQITLAKTLNILNEEKYFLLMEKITKIQKMTHSLILNTKSKKSIDYRSL